MPNGKVHEELRKRGRIFVFPLAIITPILLSPIDMRFGGEILIGIGIFTGYEMGKYVTPDWDCITATEDESKMMNELPVIGHFLFGVSSMYGSVFRRRHRKWETHVPVVSTFGRYLLLFWWIWYQIYISTLDWYWLIFIFIGMFIGTSISDFIHWYADIGSEK